MAKLNHVKSARKDYPKHGIKKGDSYFWWKFKNGLKNYSKNRPSRSMLTQSEFWGRIYDIQDSASGQYPGMDDIESDAQQIADDLRELASECESKFDNLPEGLQGSQTGDLLTERKEACEQAADAIESIDFSFDEDDDHDDVDQAKKDRAEEIWSEVTSALDEISCS